MWICPDNRADSNCIQLNILYSALVYIQVDQYNNIIIENREV